MLATHFVLHSDSDGHVELVIGYSDRVVRAFRWHELPDSDTGHFLLIQRWQLAGQVNETMVLMNCFFL